jgi:hypothetical protein
MAAGANLVNGKPPLGVDADEVDPPSLIGREGKVSDIGTCEPKLAVGNGAACLAEFELLLENYSQ